MKKKWELKKLNEVAEYFNGLTYSPKDVSDNGTIVLRSSNIKNDELDFSDIVRVNVNIKEKLFVKEGDILMCSRNGSQRLVGKTAPILNLKEPMTFGTFMMIIRSEFGPFLLYYFKTDEFKKQISGGENTMINQVTRYMLDEISLPVPPLQEQQQIVAILDEAFAAIDQARTNIQKNIQNAKELFQSKLNAVFSQKGEGWEEKSLGELGKVSMCKRILKNQTTTEGDIPFYKIGTFGKEPDAFISKSIYEEYKSKYSFPKKGDVLISASGTIGRRVVYDGEPAFFQDSNIVWIDNNEESVLNEYLYQFYGVCDWNPSKGATINRLYNDDLRRIKISYPNLEEQRKLIKLMEELSAQTKAIEDAYSEKVNSLDELKKSILQKSFSGELFSKKMDVA